MSLTWAAALPQRGGHAFHPAQTGL